MLATFRNFFDALIFLHNEGLITYCHFNGSQVKGSTSKNQQAANSIQYVESYHTSNYSDLFKNLQLGEDSTKVQNMIFFLLPNRQLSQCLAKVVALLALYVLILPRYLVICF